MSPLELSDAKRRVLERYLRGEARVPPAEDAAPEQGPVPASWGQRQVWLHSQIADRPIYNEPVTIHRRGPLDRAALSRGLAEIVRRHEAWRTGFAGDANDLRQIVHPPFSPTIAFVDLRGEPPEAREASAAAIAAEDARRPFDLSMPPLFRATLVRLADGEHRLYLTLHHIIFDGVSIYRVFLPELAALHDAFAAGRPSPLPPPGLPYRTFARRQRDTPVSEVSLAYWRRTLAELPPPLDLPLDRPRPSARTFRGAMLPLGLPRETADAVRALSRREGVTPFMALLAVFQAILHRWSGQEAFLLGSVTAGRGRSDLENVMGFFLRTIVLRADLAGDPTFSGLLRRVRDVTLGAIAHDDVPFERLVSEVDRSASADRNPLFSVLFSLEPPIGFVAPGWDLTQIDVQTGTTKFDLSLELDERPCGFVGRFIYNTDLFDAESIALLARHWRALLDSALAHPDRRVSELDLGEEPGPAADAAAAPVMDPAPTEFARRAAENPSAEALRFAGRSTRYADLAATVKRVARALAARGIGRESLVAIDMPRSGDRVAAILAVGRAGAAWMPLGSDWPRARIAAVLADARPALVVIDSARAESRGIPAVPFAELAADGEGTIGPGPRPGDLAYVLYTSGSTGAPKGVMIEHRALANLLSWSQRTYPLAPGDRVLQKAPLEFDASIWEIFAPLVAGAALVVAPPGAERDPHGIARLVRDEKITHLKLVPSLLRMLVSVPEFRQAAALRHVFCGGETLPRDLAEAFFRASPAELHNLYGPTETCVDVAAHRCRAGTAGRVPIGRAIDNARLRVLDRRGRRSPAGIPGELYVGGLPVARGYLGRDTLSRERFVPDPFGAAGERLYRTGDRVRLRPDGEIEFLGRIDDQRKVRGVRVEPGEIETALRAQPEVTDAAVVVRGEDAASSLAAYVASPGTEGPEARHALSRALRERLSSVLPRSVVPDAITVLSALPLTASGKLDRRALPEPERFAAEAGAAPESPEERLLAGIWSDVLGVSAVGIHDNLFDLGGNSLLVFQITARAAKSGYAITPRQIFEHPTIAELAAAVGTLPAMTPGMTELTA